MPSVKSYPEIQMRVSLPSYNNPPTAKEVLGEKVNILILELWEKGMDSIHDICVVNTDAYSYLKR